MLEYIHFEEEKPKSAQQIKREQTPFTREWIENVSAATRRLESAIRLMDDNGRAADPVVEMMRATLRSITRINSC